MKIIPVNADSEINTNIISENPFEVPTLGNSVPSEVSSQQNFAKQNEILQNGQEYIKQTTDNVVFGNGNIKADSSVGAEKDEANRETSSPRSIKIVTFDQMPDEPALETDSLRNSETSGNNENLQNLVPNPLPKYTVSSDSSVSGEKCDEFSCLNSGKCVDDGTVFRNKVRCDCELGTLGAKCEKGKKSCFLNVI